MFPGGKKSTGTTGKATTAPAPGHRDLLRRLPLDHKASPKLTDRRSTAAMYKRRAGSHGAQPWDSSEWGKPCRKHFATMGEST